ncbi:VanZ family protein [Butyrivibrio sp.]|nr:VanZ family protein [Butyrivibrio sp.]
MELSQIFCDGRHTDIDDLILNTCGVVIGAVILFSIRKAKKAAK